MNRDPHNPWFKTKGGVDTIDNIFLLCLDKVGKYFGDCRENFISKGSQKWSIDDENNGKRQAKFDSDYHWWRLRSTGNYSRTAATGSSSGGKFTAFISAAYFFLR